MHVLIETLIASMNRMSFLCTPIVFNRKLKEIGGIEFEPWLKRPFCHALRNMFFYVANVFYVVINLDSIASYDIVV